MKRIEKLGAGRLPILKALVEGGCVEKRRAYPFPETFHLRRANSAGDSATKVGVEFEDTQDALFGDDAGKYEERRITGMEAA